MRPVRRGATPQNADFTPYRDALPFLISRLGSYCSYCERRIVTQLAVEHIQPKSLPAYNHLTGRWENFLLGCVNCNSTKLDKDVLLTEIFLPDRDNTFAAFSYHPDGTIKPSSHCNTPDLRTTAQRTLALTGLDKRIIETHDENGKQIAIDRAAQRMEVWAIAEEAKSDLTSAPTNQTLRRGIIRAAEAHGFFSIWMTVFHDDIDLRNRLIDAFAGTRASACFNTHTTQPMQPAPNPDNLQSGGKI